MVLLKPSYYSQPIPQPKCSKAPGNTFSSIPFITNVCAVMNHNRGKFMQLAALSCAVAINQEHYQLSMIMTTYMVNFAALWSVERANPCIIEMPFLLRLSIPRRGRGRCILNRIYRRPWIRVVMWRRWR
jgi:hypothetical protein